MNVTLHTNHGDIVVTLFPDHAPKTVENFVGLAKGEKEYKDDAGRTNPTPFYDGLIFHRVIPGFMIQGGCPLGQRHRRPGLHVQRRDQPRQGLHQALPARHGQRRQAHGQGHQRLAVLHHRRPRPPWLNGKHTIFGEVADGPSRDVVDAIAAVPTGANDKPVERRRHRAGHGQRVGASTPAPSRGRQPDPVPFRPDPEVRSVDE